MSEDPSVVKRAAVTWRGMLLALLGSAFAGTTILAVANLGKFTSSVGVYHAAVFVAFFMLYWLIPGGFASHFATPTPSPSAGDVAYFAAITHCTVGYGDMYPKTGTARLLVLAHVFLAFIVMANVVPIGDSVFSYSTFVTGD